MKRYVIELIGGGSFDGQLIKGQEKILPHIVLYKKLRAPYVNLQTNQTFNKKALFFKYYKTEQIGNTIKHYYKYSHEEYR